MEFFDSHSHYNDEKFNSDREEIIQKTLEEGISRLNCVGYNIPSSYKSIELAKKYPFIYAVCGISPNDVPDNEDEIEEMIKQIEQMVKKDELKKIVAIGEIGLDYYWNKENKQIQKKVFEEQINIANKYKLPIVIHTREAQCDTLEILNKIKVEKTGVFHCCPLNRELVKQALKLGYYISFAGPITFKNAKNAEEIVSMIPLEKILIETDSPYLAPEPKRGTRNDSRNVKLIAEKIAKIKNISLEEVAKTTYQNTKEIFKL